MAVAELVKTAFPGYPWNANFACLDFLGRLGDFLVVPHAPRPGCICDGQRDVWQSLNEATRFARLSMYWEKAGRVPSSRGSRRKIKIPPGDIGH